MSRRKAREYALQLLFQNDFAAEKPASNFPEEFWPNKDENKDIRKFTDEIVQGTINNLENIDRAIQGTADHWKVDRMAAVDRNILRFAVYEILYRDDIPTAVTINEALEIAKKYSSLESASFINGLLDKIASDSGKE